MRFLAQLSMRLRMLFTRRRAAGQLDREIQFHVDRQMEENIAAGMSREEARTAALRQFGNPALLRDHVRATWSWTWAEQLGRDLRLGIRSLRRSPGFAAIAILVIALGIGANVALFTVVRSVLLKPLPYAEPDRLITLYGHITREKKRDQFYPVDGGSAGEWQRAAQGSADVAIISIWQNYNISSEGGRLPERVDAGWCSANFFPVLGVKAQLGRVFSPDDDRPGSDATVVLSNALWRRRYQGDPSIVGRQIWLDARPYTVIGVLPPWFVFSSFFGGNTVQLWTAVHREAPPALLRTFEDHEFQTVARLRPGVTLAALLSQLNAAQKHVVAEHGGPSVHDAVEGRPLLEDAIVDYKTPLYALFAATLCVLVIACMNVAGLLVARTAARRRDLAIRAALGGGRMRLVRERLTESLLLSLAGGGAGLLLAWGALQWLVRTRSDMNRVESIQIDGVVATFTVGAIALCALVSGLIAAAGVSMQSILSTLQESSRAHSGYGRATLRQALLVLQVGLTMVLLVGAGLLLKSFAQLRSTSVGVPIDNVLTMKISLPENQYKGDAQTTAFFEQLISRVRAVPGVEAAGLVSVPPGEGWGGDHLMLAVEHPEIPREKSPDMHVRGADPGYFAAIQLPLLRGRVFTSAERLQRANVVVLSQSGAHAAFGDEDPIGKHLKVDLTGEVFEIVGVVADTRWRVDQPIKPTLYWPIYGNDYSVATIVVRSTHNVESLAVPVQRLVSQMDPNLPVANVRTLREAIAASTVDSEFDSLLVAAFAVIALLLAAAGLYGVLAYLVTQRTGEIGIRIALGSPRARVLNAMLFDGLRPALLGLVLGLIAGAAVVRQIKSMLFETQPLDPWVFAAVAAVLLAVAAFACLLPAWRASRLNPMQALRVE